jgi:ubiquinone/menaquinone biosynthesis C-methylase UbiE
VGRDMGGRQGVTHWFEPLATHVGAAYLRYSFTKGTEQEVAFLMDALSLRPGMRVLDVGCGPGRHAHALAQRGIDVVGIDISETFIELARQTPGPTFIRGDAREMTFDEEFDAAICLCQGAFGLNEGDDALILQRLIRALKPDGRAAVSAFSAYFQVRFLEDTDAFDADAGINHERTVVRDTDGAAKEFDLWTTVFTPRELRLLAAPAAVEAMWSVAPGQYGRNPPDIEHPEFLMILRAPSARR